MNKNPALAKIINIEYQDGTSAWYMEFNKFLVSSSAFTCGAIIKQFDHQKTVEDYSPKQSEVVRQYTTYTF